MVLSECSGRAARLPELEMKLTKTRFRLGTVQGVAACQQPGQLGWAPCSTVGPVWGTPTGPAGVPEGRDEWPPLWAAWTVYEVPSGL